MASQEFLRPDVVPFPADAPYDREIATLGKMLFFDARLSGAQNMSCASCHSPSFGWETPASRAIGALGQHVKRHAPSLINAAWGRSFNWDGRASSLEVQAVGPLTDPREMNANFEMIIERLSSVSEYQTHFQRIFPDQGITEATILRSLATFQRTIVSGTAPFDRWVEGAEGAISDPAKRGFQLFTGRANCVSCHIGWNFTDHLFHDTGLNSMDLGRGGLTPLTDTGRYQFKTPGLRNIGLRAPFMHDGSLPTLEAVVLHYVRGGDPAVTRAHDVRPFEASEEDVADLVAFLEALTEERTDVRSPILPAN